MTIQRRQLLRYGGASFLSAIGTFFLWDKKTYGAQTAANSVKVQWLGHSCFLFSGGGLRVLVNPFESLGCTAGYRLPPIQTDLVLISSYLLDEGAVERVPGNPQILAEPGDYQVKGLKFQGITIAHDREQGRRFGDNVAWRWTQGGINFLHLGGVAAPIAIEQKILMGSPDVVFLPVGGGAKAYNPQEAKQAIEVLKPKIAIPTQYLTKAADKSSCDLLPVEDFLQVVKGMPTSRYGTSTISMKRSDLPKEGTVVRVFGEPQTVANR
ncbi:MAG: MBL fold metallo-hydrolase [Xenococcaceae cyanobacterium]